MLLQDDTSTEGYFAEWQRDSKISIVPDDYTRRIQIFKQNLANILAINQQGNKTYVLAPNRFCHLTDDEFMQGYLGVGSSAPSISADFTGSFDGSPPPVVDWVEQGKVTSVKDQERPGKPVRPSGQHNMDLYEPQQMLQGWAGHGSPGADKPELFTIQAG